MRSGKSLLLVTLALCLCVAGCSNGSNSASNQSQSNSTSGTSATSTPGSFSTWQFVGQENPSGGPANVLLGLYLLQNGTSVSGMAVYLPFCSQPTLTAGILASPTGEDAVFIVSGSFQNGTLSLNSGVVADGGFGMTATYSPSKNVYNGTFPALLSAPATAECGADDNITGTAVPSYSGTWTGTMQSASGTQAQITASLVEGTVDPNTFPNQTVASDQFPALTGSVTITGTPCFTTGTFSGNQMGPVLAGLPNYDILMGGKGVITTTDGEIDLVALPAGWLAVPGTAYLTFVYSVSGGNCNGDHGTGTLNRQ